MATGPLRALELALRFAVACGRAADGFPVNQERLADQLRRAATSVTLNVAEGSTRVSFKDYRRFLDTARASLKEAEIALKIAHGCRYIAPEEYAEIEALRDETARTLYGLIRYVDQKVAAGIGRRRIP